MSTNASRNWSGRRGTRSSSASADEHCIETLELSLAAYESIRASPVRFPVKVGHDYPEFERVVALSDGYAVVEKIGAAAEVAKTLDPRSQVNGGSLVDFKNGPS
jgi:5-bromo-4-chloroindolyl phosphate hydrolysis protein